MTEALDGITSDRLKSSCETREAGWYDRGIYEMFYYAPHVLPRAGFRIVFDFHGDLSLRLRCLNAGVHSGTCEYRLLLSDKPTLMF